MNRAPALRWTWALGLILLAACGLPGDVKQEAGKKVEKIALAREAVSRKAQGFRELAASDDFRIFEPYAQRENWAAGFDDARRMLDAVEKEVTAGRVAELLRRNRKEEAGALRVELAKIDRLIRKAAQRADAPRERMAYLETVREEAPRRAAAAAGALDAVNALVRGLEEEEIPRARSDHPRRAEEILKRFGPLKRLQEEVVAAEARARRELEKHTAGAEADYAVLGEDTERVVGGLETLKKSAAAYRETIAELYRSYTRILEDMRIDFFVTVGRVSWNEGSDFWRETPYIYPPGRVDRKTYDYFAGLDPGVVPAAYTTGWGGRYRLQVPPPFWQALKIDPVRNWPSRSDTHAEFWIEDFFPKAYHKYLLVENDRRRTTDWVAVDEEVYDENREYLGMEILSKPYGYFEDERVREASPPGMAMVGDDRYGEWRTDPAGGRSFWYYYGVYAFLNRGPRYHYYRDGWERWRSGYRNREPYFGGSAAAGAVYGTYGSGTRTDSRYRDTAFAKQGGFRAQAPSLRGAGPASRGGGPGARGK